MNWRTLGRRSRIAASSIRERDLLSDAEELIGAGSFDWDIANDRIIWSRGMHRLRGLELGGPVTSEDSVGGLHPDDEVRVKQRMREALAANDTIVDQEYRLVHSDGTVLHVETRARIERDESGAAKRVVGVTVDVTARHDAIEASSEAFIACDQYGKISGWNLEAEKLLGWSRTEIIGRSIIDTITPPGMRDSRRAALQRYRATGMGPLITTRIEVSMVQRSGHEIPVEMAVWATRVGADVHFNLHVHDITDRQRVQHDLAVARDQALEASRLKSTFLANMSHEIRTPMNGVIGMTELLLDTELSGRQSLYAEVITSSGEALLAIIDQILDFSKIESGKLDLESREFALHDMVAGVCEMLAPKAYGKGIELPLFVAEDVPTHVLGDVGRLRQVLTNLVGNAVKFTDSGEVALSVQAAGAGLIEFAVTDTGPGINTDQQEALFEPFAQADASTTRRFGGTGLGLTISRQLVRLMGGEITVDSELGEGSTFRFTIELTSAGDRNAPVKVPPPRSPSSMRVLVVNDNATSRRILTDYLCAVAAEVSTAAGEGEALRVLGEAADKKAPFQLVILDDQLPGTAGTDVAIAVRSDPRLHGAAMLVLTSAGSPPPTADAFTGCVTISKPIRRGRLHEAIAEVLQARPRPSTAAATASQAPTARLGARILLAEDNPVNQLMAKQMLTLRGYEVDVAQNGLQVLESMSASSYDLVLMDCQMPELDGYQTTAEIRRRESALPGRRVPVVALTANSLPGERESCLAASMDDYISKPFRRHQLDAILEHWIPLVPVVNTLPAG